MRQVLNMKPPEILGMLEEAAGTRMYEMKKDAALRTLEKKQVKVEEINAVRTCMQGKPKICAHAAEQRGHRWLERESANLPVIVHCSQGRPAAMLLRVMV